MLRRARRILVECSWSYQHPPRVGKEKQEKVAAAPPAVREIAWKAQCRLSARYRALTRKGKLKTVAVTAVARELSAFIWAINREIATGAAAPPRKRDELAPSQTSYRHVPPPGSRDRTASYPKWRIAVRGAVTYFAVHRATHECLFLALATNANALTLRQLSGHCGSGSTVALGRSRHNRAWCSQCSS